MISVVKKHILLAIFLVCYLGFLAFKVTMHPTPFFDWDESLYVQTGIEMVQQKYVLFPVWQGEVWLDKPPLIPLLYGLVIKTFFFLPPEVSARLFSVAVAGVALTFSYLLFMRVTKHSLLSTTAVALTALTPIFLQRAQIVNLDMPVLVGWLGYALFFNNFWLSFFFLLISVFTKSLIGFYPIGVFGAYFTYLLVIKKIKFAEYRKHITQLAIHTGIFALWYGAMFALFGMDFYKMHIVESHFRRVTASIESHFGQRTFYIDVAREQFDLYFWLALGGLAVIIGNYFKKIYKEKDVLHAIYLLPWFMFLNVTKTKIWWYFVPAIPQFAFLAVLPITLVKKNKQLTNILAVALLAFLFYNSLVKHNVLAQTYSKPEPYYQAALEARKSCTELTVLVDGGTRNTTKTLGELGLLISTTKWWGNHPSIVYYSGKKVTYAYTTEEFIKSLQSMKKDECALLEKPDASLVSREDFEQPKVFASFLLFRKN